MRNFVLRLAEAGEADGGAPKDSPATNEASAPKDEGAGDNTDDFGYKVTPAEVKPGEEAAKPKEKAPEEKPKEEPIKPATGYGEKAPKEEPGEAAPPAEEPKVDLGYELEVKNLDPKEALKLQEFAKANALPKEAAQALVNLRRSEFDAAKAAQAEKEKAQAKAIEVIKANWDKELRTDSTFGGEKFAHNLLQVEKVLAEFMPGTKKALTERGSMLPPYVMRDLAKLAEKLYATEKLVQGDVTVGEVVVEDKRDDHLDFYKM